MGYYTNYKLDILNVTQADKIRILAEIRSNDEDIPLNSTGVTNDPCKWYNHEMDIKHHSKRYPNFIFALEGHGEDLGDVWCKYFKNGLMYKVEFTFPEFDESKLK